MSLVKRLLSYRFFFDDITEFVKNHGQKRKFFFQSYFLVYPKLNQSLKWRYDYIIIAKKINYIVKNGGPIR